MKRYEENIFRFLSILKKFRTKLVLYLPATLIAFLRIGAQLFFLCGVGNPHTLTLDIQDERILVRCRPNNDNLRLDISRWKSLFELNSLETKT